MKKVRVFAPASIANMGCGFDVIGLALDEVGDIIEITESEGDGLSITNLSGVPLPDDPEKNVVTPVIRSFLQKIGKKAQIDVTICQKIYPGSGIGSSAASSAAAAMGMPVRRFISAANANSVIPEFLESGIYRPRPSVFALWLTRWTWALQATMSV